jgi:phage terminase large subunit-like protein
MTEFDIKVDIARVKKIVDDYIDGVLSGKIITCRFVRLAVQRHVNDLKDGPTRGLIFREDKAYHAVKFFSFLKLWKGKEYKGKEFVLAPHRVFITWVLMGWYKTDGTRRFRKAYDEEARKSSKTTYVGGIAAYFLIADGEESADVFCAAVKRDQAKLVWDNVKNLTKDTGFAKNITYLTNKLTIEATNSKCEPLSSDAKSLDGLDTHFASLDELHAHPSGEVYNLIDDSIGARRQPMIFVITTAGFNQTGVCYEMRDYLTKVLKGTIQDDSFFGIIFTLDTKKDWPDLKDKKEPMVEGEIREDDWTNEDIWVKAAPALIGVTESGKKFGLDENGNPTPGYMTKIEDMRDKCRIAKQVPSEQNNFLTKRLNIWTQSENRWLDLALWDANNVRPVTEETCKGRACVGGIDLSSVSDLTVWGMLFRDELDKDLVDILFRVWCPEARLFDTKNKYRDQYKAWEKAGYLTVTPGDAIDYDMIRGKIAGYTDVNGIYVPGDKDIFKIQSISVDRGFQGYEFSQKLDLELGGTEKDPKVMACGMGWVSMNGPCQELERLLLLKKLNNGGNPIARFAADNVSVKINPTGGGKSPNKASSQGKIDPIVVILLCLDRLLRVPAVGQSLHAGRSVEEILQSIST